MSVESEKNQHSMNRRGRPGATLGVCMHLLVCRAREIIQSCSVFLGKLNSENIMNITRF